MNKTLIAATAAASLMAGTALAQTNSSDTKTSSDMKAPVAAQSQTAAPAATGDTKGMSQTAAPAATGDMKGITTAKTASMAVRFVAPKPADLMISNLIGLDVYNKQNEKLGEIEDVSIDNGTTLSGVVVSVGGFLGMNERYVMIDPATIVLNRDDDTWKAFVDTSRDSLKNAPKFEYGETKS